MTPIPKIQTLAAQLTDAQLAGYIAANCEWVTLDRARGSQSIRIKTALDVYAGPNPMAHYCPQTKYAGMYGASQVLSRMFSQECAKYLAGSWLKSARWCRASGDRVAAFHCMRKARNQIARARQMPSEQHTFKKERAA